MCISVTCLWGVAILHSFNVVRGELVAQIWIIHNLSPERFSEGIETRKLPSPEPIRNPCRNRRTDPRSRSSKPYSRNILTNPRHRPRHQSGRPRKHYIKRLQPGVRREHQNTILGGNVLAGQAFYLGVSVLGNRV